MQKRRCQRRRRNKLPRNSNGSPWRVPENRKVDINHPLGRNIGYGVFKGLKLDATWDHPSQPFGWDKPKMTNARLSRQKGFFVYNLDVSRTLHEDLSNDSGGKLEKFEIERALVGQIHEELEQRGYDQLSLYLDLDKEFDSWRNQHSLWKRS